RFFCLPAAPLRLRALVRFLLFIDLARKGIEAREKVRRGRTRPGEIAGVVGHPLSPKVRFPARAAPGNDAANDTLPRPPRARSASAITQYLDSARERVALRRRLVAVLLVERLNLSSQPRACVGEIGARLARSGELEQPSVIKLRLRGVARACRSEARAVQAAIAARLAQLRRLVFPPRPGRARELHQHVTEQLARGQQAPRRDDVLLALVLDVGCLAHETECLVHVLP